MVEWALLLALGLLEGGSALKASPPARLLPKPRVIAVRGRPHVFQLLDYEVSCLPGVHGVMARKLALLCGYEGTSHLCAANVPQLPAKAPSWTPEAASRRLVTCWPPPSQVMIFSQN